MDSSYGQLTKKGIYFRRKIRQDLKLASDYRVQHENVADFKNLF